MKACLFVLLLAVVCCSTDPVEKFRGVVDVLTCVLKSQVVWDVISEVYEMVQSGDYSQLLPLVLQKYQALVNVFKACLPAK